jgi:small subunit ribosomal protein S6
MRRYETIIITDPDLSLEQRDPVLKRVSDVINQGDGYLALTDEWGARKLAYEIKKRDRGYYIRFDFCGTGAMINEMERFFRIDDRVLKYMTVLLDKAADIEKIKEEMAATQSAAEKTMEQAEIAAAQVSSEEPSKAQIDSDEIPTPSGEQVEAQTDSDVIPTPSEEQAETEETQTPEIGESEAALEETEEEKK